MSEALRRAVALYQRGEWVGAEQMCRTILSTRSDHFDALHLLGIIVAQRGGAQEAAQLLSKAVLVNTVSPTAYNNLGNVMRDLRRYSEALENYNRAVALNPDFASAYNNRGKTLRDLCRCAEALQSFERAISLNPGAADFYVNRGAALRDLGRYREALESCDRAIALKTEAADAHNFRGSVLRDLRNYPEALSSYERAIALKPGSADAYNNRGVVLRDLRRFDEALLSFDRAIALKPESADAYNNRSIVLRDLGRHVEALESLEHAIAIEPDHTDALINRGTTLRDLKRYDAALESFGHALRLEPDHDFLYGDWLFSRMEICEWADYSSHVAHLTEKIEHGERSAQPFLTLATLNSVELQRKACEIWTQASFPSAHPLPQATRHPGRQRIRIGYISADFCDHPVSALTSRLFEEHDRDRFDVVALSYGPDTGDAMRERIIAAVDRFVDLRERSDDEAARLIRELEIDIAIDLGGFTQHSRTGILAARAAPLQASYLGFLGTMGASFIDYILADRVLIPVEQQKFYSEKIVYLPTYQPSNSHRRISDTVPTREELGLPKAGFVFCCFSNNYKITPGTFDRWMSILKNVDDSVLFLYAENGWAERNLKREATLRGVDPGRLVFGARLPMPEYLARYRAADLFLDTFPYNAGATASDALWTGLPLLTCAGETFASRIAASVLDALELPDLITDTQDQYVATAIELSKDPGRLEEIGRRLHLNRRSAPSFDSTLFARQIEDAFSQMYERHHAGLPPDHIYVSS